jgi:hypothetical protein
VISVGAAPSGGRRDLGCDLGGGVISVDAAPYFLEDEDRYLFHAAYKVSR